MLKSIFTLQIVSLNYHIAHEQSISKNIWNEICIGPYEQFTMLQCILKTTDKEQ